MNCSFCGGHPYVIYSTAVNVPDPTLLTSVEGSRRYLSPHCVSGSLAFPCMHDCYSVVLYHSTGAVDQNCGVKPSPVSGNTLAFLVIPNLVVWIFLGIRRTVWETLSFCSEVVSIFKTLLSVFCGSLFCKLAADLYRPFINSNSSRLMTQVSKRRYLCQQTSDSWSYLLLCESLTFSL